MNYFRLVHERGFRYRLHVRELPRTLDLIFPRLESVIWGCELSGLERVRHRVRVFLSGGHK
ncbi:MAG: very short patch repair endonuclease [Xanthomonadaceae bacterium]|nr:very short patch repair endonuclease [Xanthomonadaceae bacterium]